MQSRKGRGKMSRTTAFILALILMWTSVLTGALGRNTASAEEGDAAPSRWYQNFEKAGAKGDFGIQAVGSASSAAVSSAQTAYLSSKKSVRLVQTNDNNPSGGAWNTDVYGFRAGPQEDVAYTVAGNTYYDASSYSYFSFYVLDGDAHNPNIVFKDADGRSWNAPTDGINSVKDQWTRLSVQLDKSQLDFSRLVSVSIGEYWGWGNTYSFDELYFAKTADDLPPAYPDGPEEPQSPSAPLMYQSFDEPGQDGSYGLMGQGSATAARPVRYQSAYSSSAGSLEAVHHSYIGGDGKDSNEAWDTGIYGVRIAPQGDATVTGAAYTDASNYSYLKFYVKDTTAQAGSNIHIVFKDADGGVWDTDSGQAVKTEPDKWVQMTVKLDKSKLDFSKLSEIQLGTFWGWNNKYYYDDLYLAQNESDLSPAYEPEATKLFHDFENGEGFSAGSGATVELSDDVPSAAEKTSVKLTAAASGWPYVNNSYMRALPKSGESFDASGYKYLAFYIKDTQGSNGAEIRLYDADGAVLDKWGSVNSKKDKWTKILLPLNGETGIDLSRIKSVDIGQYNAGVYYIDDIFFAMSEDDELPGFLDGADQTGSVWYQSFETKGQDGKYGLVAGTGVAAEVTAERSANPHHSFSIKAVVAADSADYAVNGIGVAPQALGASPDKTKPYDYRPEMDATAFSHLIFYVWDAQGGQQLLVRLTDSGGRTLDAVSEAATAANSWNRIAVPLDKSANFRFAQLSQVTVKPEKAGIYYIDEFYLGVGADGSFPNEGYTQLALKDVGGEALPYANGVPLGSFEKQKDRTYLSLSGGWKKQRMDLDSALSASPRGSERQAALEEEADGRQQPGYDDSGWAGKTLPMPEDEMGPYESVSGPEGKSDKSGYQGGVWYRKHVEVDASMEGQPVRLSFLGVNYYADVWINGHYAGGHQGGYTPFALDAAQWLNYGGDNVIAVRVDNPKWDSFDNGEILPYKTSDWFNYTGILRDAYLEFLPQAHVVRSDVTVPDISGTVDVRTFLDNAGVADSQAQLTYSIYEADVKADNRLSEYAEDLAGGQAVASGSANAALASGGQAVNKLRLQIPNPKLWSPAHPNLYILKVELKQNGSVKDSFFTQFGIRTLEADGVQIKLNGELAPFLAGMGYTEDSADKGPSLEPATRYSDLSKIKLDMKANFIRTGHFPHSLATYQYADRIGLAVWQEIPAYWFSGAAFDLQRQRGQAKQMLEEMIFSNYNRPSVWFDGVANESAGQLERVNYIAEMRDTAHAIDGTRLVGQSAVANPYEGESDHSHSGADVIGMTMYFGAFYGANTDAETQEEIERISALHPGKPIIATEYGYWSGDESPADTRQTQLFTGTFNAFARTATVKEDGMANASGLLSGAAWWTAYNWYTNITGLQTMGLYHMDRKTAKPVKDVLAERYDRYTHTDGGEKPVPAGISAWFQSFDSGKGFRASDSRIQLEPSSESAGGSGRSLEIDAGEGTDGSHVSFVPQGGTINSDLSVYNQLNFFAKDSRGGRPLTVTLIDSEGRAWSSVTEESTVQDKWARLSVSLADAQGVPLSSRRLNTMAITEIRIGVSSGDKLLIDNAYAATYKDGAMPESYPVGSSGWFQSFEEEGVTVGQGKNAVAEVDTGFGVNPGGKGSVKLEVKGSGGAPGPDAQSVLIRPQGGAASIDASDFNYLAFYVKDMQGSNTVHITFVDTDGNVSDGNWTDVPSVKGQWTKVYIPLAKTSADIRKLKEIRLAEWNPGVYHFDDLYFAEYPTDEIPATYTEKIPEKPQPEGRIKVAAVGDSITAGAGMDYAGVTSYPAQLQTLLGGKYEVKNFGVSGRTLMKSGDDPYWNEAAFAASKSYGPDIVVIQLGTNDTKTWNWKNGVNSFRSDYEEMIRIYQDLPSHPKVYVNLPPTVYNDDPNEAYGILSSVLQNGVVPLVKQAAEATGAAVIDVNAATAGQAADFPDKVHPNPKGAWTIAGAVAKQLKGAAGAAGETEVCTWKDCKPGAYTIVYDDGIYDSVLRFAGLHEKYDLKGTLALISDWIDNSYNDVGASTGSWEQWKALLDKGYFDAASHTATHRDLTALTPSEVKAELEKSIAEIKAHTGFNPDTLALPYNATNEAVTAEAAKHFAAARGGGSNAGNAPGTSNYYNLSSIMADSTTTVKKLDDWTDFGIAKGNWLILTGHGNDGEGWSSPPLSLFDGHYGYVKDRKDALWNGTLNEVGKYLRERQSVQVQAAAAAGGAIEVTMTGLPESPIYDQPLTLRTKVPAGWTEAEVRQGGITRMLKPVSEGEGSFLYYDVLPVEGIIRVEEKKEPGTDPGPSPSPSPGSSVSPSPNPSANPSPSPNPNPSANPSPSPNPSANPSPSPNPSANPSPSPKPGPDPIPDSIPSPGTRPSPSPTPGSAAAGTAVLSLDEAAVKAAIDAASANADGITAIAFEIQAASGSERYELSLPAAYLAHYSKLRIAVSTPIGRFILSGDMFAGLDGSAGTIAVSLGKSGLPQASAAVLAASGGRPAVELLARIDGKPASWSSAKKTVELQLPYKASASESAHSQRLTVWAIQPDGKADPIVSGRYDPVSQSMKANVRSFGRYAVVSAERTFGDLLRHDWVRPAIESLASKGAVNGTQAGEYSPGRPVTRAEAVTLLMKVLDLHAEAEAAFGDIESGAYYEEAVASARAMGIVKGQGGNVFHPQLSVSRQDMMVMIAGAMKAAGMKTGGETRNLNAYKDGDSFAAYARSSAASLLEAGLLQGSDGYLHPATSLTRAEAAVLLERLYQLAYPL